MKINKEALRRAPWLQMLAGLLIALCVLLILLGVLQSNQSAPPTFPDVSFIGEYRIGEGEWSPIVDGEHISATKGDVTLRGYLQLYNPESGEPLAPAAGGTTVAFYLDHIGATVTDGSGRTYTLDNENEIIGEDSCAEVWSTYTISAGAGSELTITLKNGHAFGNERAVDTFISSLQLYGGADTDAAHLKEGALLRGTSVVILIIAFISLGIALFSALLHISGAKELTLIGLLVLFAGTYFLFSAPGISEFTGMYMLNTRVLGVSMMLYTFVCSCLISIVLAGRLRLTATLASAAVGCATLVAILLPIFGSVYFYDTYPWWLAIASAATLTQLCALIVGLCRDKGQDVAYRAVGCVAALACLSDAVANLFGAWQGAYASMTAFILVLSVSIVFVVRTVPRSLQATQRANEMWLEKQAMEIELQESRISIMLSQIQPHFLYNTLNSIYGLCVSNPLLAQSMVNSFSEYLRNNLSSLDCPGLIPFDTELSHTKTYLDIEKIRFDDTLEIEYDIAVSDFELPVLTVQPIVENAIKHGTSKKRGGGTVRISTRELDDCYVVTVEDTGRGFDPSVAPDDGKRHVGIENVRQRLKNMCGGSLSIESAPGAGTTASIRIPKEGKNEDHSS